MRKLAAFIAIILFLSVAFYMYGYYRSYSVDCNFMELKAENGLCVPLYAVKCLSYSNKPNPNITVSEVHWFNPKESNLIVHVQTCNLNQTCRSGYCSTIPIIPYIRDYITGYRYYFIKV